MDRRDDAELNRELDAENSLKTGETHASTGGAAAAGAVTGGVIGLTGGPIGAAIGAVGGAIVGAAAERMMHSDDEAEPHMSTDSGVAALRDDAAIQPRPVDRYSEAEIEAATTDVSSAPLRHERVFAERSGSDEDDDSER